MEMRDYKRFDEYLNNLSKDVYAQPPDRGHTDFAKAFLGWSFDILMYGGSVLDVGCGQGFCSPMFEKKGFAWTGATIGDDYHICSKAGLNVQNWDMTFLPVPDGHYDVIFARHVLEHSPFPILTLMEWKRVMRKHLMLVLPSPDYWGFGGLNHYSVLTKEQWWHQFDRAGLRIIHEAELRTNHSVFMRHYLPDVEDRSEVVFPGAPKSVEYWYILEKNE